MMIRGHRSLRLVILNACEGARSARDDPFGGVAQALVRQGIPAVIAMQFEISDPAALTFSQSFYQAIADGLPVDLAMVEARRAIFAEGYEVEWATPVLYLRSPDGRIFTKARIPHGQLKAQEDAERADQGEAKREVGEEPEEALHIGERLQQGAVIKEEEERTAAGPATAQAGTPAAAFTSRPVDPAVPAAEAETSFTGKPLQSPVADDQPSQPEGDQDPRARGRCSSSCRGVAPVVRQPGLGSHHGSDSDWADGAVPQAPNVPNPRADR